jgi:phosphate transport system substrate-binding protein
MKIRQAHLISSLVLAAGVSSLGWLQAQTAQIRAKISPVIPAYQPKIQVKGPIDLIGTDSIPDLGEEWSAAFRKSHPEANMIYRPKQTKEALKGFIDGSTLLVITSREMTADETKAFQAKFGYMPMRIPVCLDANIVFVNKVNPITSISMEQLDAIYSRTHLGGAKAPAVVWGDLGLKGEWSKMPIHAYTREVGASTRSSIQEKVLLNGEFRQGILDRTDPDALAQAVTTDQAGIAIATMSSWYIANKVLPVTPFQGEDARFPNQENVTTSRYPMPRLYYAYLNRTPGAPLPGPVNEVIQFLLTQDGQNAVADSGLLPGPPEFITIALKRLSR